MARVLLPSILVFLCLRVAAYNDIRMDPDNPPVAGEPYTLTWSNFFGDQVRVDLNELTNPGEQVETHAGVRVGFGINNGGYYKFQVPDDVRSDIEYEFKIGNNVNDYWSHSDAFNITDASGTGLPQMQIWSSDGAVSFSITIGTPWPTGAPGSFSTTTDDSSSSTAAPTATSTVSSTNSYAPPPTTSPPSSASTANSTPSSSSHSLSGGTVAGITISMFVFGIACSAALFVFLRRRKRQSQQRAAHSGHYHQEPVPALTTNHYSDKEVHHHHQLSPDPSSADGSRTSPATTDRDRHTWDSSFASPISELASNSVPGYELNLIERSPVDERASRMGTSEEGGERGERETQEEESNQSERQRERAHLLELPERGSTIKTSFTG